MVPQLRDTALFKIEKLLENIAAVQLAFAGIVDFQQDALDRARTFFEILTYKDSDLVAKFVLDHLDDLTAEFETHELLAIVQKLFPTGIPTSLGQLVKK
jgi:hypothetical protein